MSLARLRARVPSANSLGTYFLTEHALRFHKLGKDGSAKCDAFQTKNFNDVVFGVLFELEANQKPALDFAEDLGRSYNEKPVIVKNDCGEECHAFMYYATCIESNIKPYTWYLHHVVMGAKENYLPEQYIKMLALTPATKDHDTIRAQQELAIYSV